MNGPPHDWSRRGVLRAVGATSVGAVAGCVTDESRSAGCTSRAELSLRRARSAHISNEFSTPLDGTGHATRTAVADAIAADDGEATARGYYSPAPPTEFVVTGPEPHYYRVETATGEAVSVRAPAYQVTIDVDESAVEDGTPIRSFEKLPPQDRASLRSAIGNPTLLHAPHYTSFAVVFAYERAEQRRRSVFVPGESDRYLEWDGVLLRLSFEARRSVDVTSTTVSAERVATSRDGFVEVVGAERGVVLDSLTDRQREIVAEATEGTYGECEPYSGAYSDLQGRLAPLAADRVGLARYDREWYFVDYTG
ncbi:hypothetical protein ACFQL1_22690 [Halomicroarcula sp. GCM10025709]|uniref:hypothetical protein n=1 Tax=Haloarcula TaxID=2237 RepID=UPI0024C30F0A|nr:hypothetical protein [Halomicroarcula sp. YJ-61-S]